jgi:hypothetical protein
MGKGKDPEPDPDLYLWRMDPGQKSCGSCGSESSPGSPTGMYARNRQSPLCVYSVVGIGERRECRVPSEYTKRGGGRESTPCECTWCCVPSCGADGECLLPLLAQLLPRLRQLPHRELGHIQALKLTKGIYYKFTWHRWEKSANTIIGKLYASLLNCCSWQST